MQRTQTAKVGKALRPVEVQNRKGQLEGNKRARQKTNNAPKGGGNDPVAHDTIEIFVLQIAGGRYRLIRLAKCVEEKPTSHEHHDDRVHLVSQIARIVDPDHRKERDQTKRYQLEIIRHLASL